jgi:hypothetical protein
VPTPLTVPPLRKEPTQQRRRLLLADATIDVGAVMAGRGGEEPHAAFDRAALRVGGAVVEPADAGERQRAGAHGAGLERHVDIAIDEALGSDRGSRRAQRQHLSMRGRVMVGERAVALPRDDLAVAHDDAADRHLARSGRGARFGEGQVHVRLGHEGLLLGCCHPSLWCACSG